MLLASHSHNSPIENTDNKGKRKEEDPTPFNSQSPQEASLPFLPRITYELNTDSDEFEPHLRLWVGSESKFSLGDLSLPASSLSSLPSNPAEDGTAPDLEPSGPSLHPDEGTSSSPTPDLIEPIQSK